MKLVGHHEFSVTQCPMDETEAGNSYTNRGSQDTRFSSISQRLSVKYGTILGLTPTRGDLRSGTEFTQQIHFILWCEKRLVN